MPDRQGVLPLLKVLMLHRRVVQRHREHRRQICALPPASKPLASLRRVPATAISGSLGLPRLWLLLFAIFLPRNSGQTFAQPRQGLLRGVQCPLVPSHNAQQP